MADQNTAVFPPTSSVISGVKYGPTGTDFTGALSAPTNTSAMEIVEAIWSHKLALNTVNFTATK
jgi:hypothetical protein